MEYFTLANTIMLMLAGGLIGIFIGIVLSVPIRDFAFRVVACSMADKIRRIAELESEVAEKDYLISSLTEALDSADRY